MKVRKFLPIFALVVFFMYAISSHAAIITVAKNGSGMFTTIQGGVDASKVGDTVKILDVATYNEQVTINSTHYGIVLTSANPTSPSKPKIVWKDEANVGPKNCAQAQIDSFITFDQNGALRLMRARNVQINGITVDGGGPMAIGSSGPVWPDRSRPEVGCMWPNLHGNVAILVWLSGGAIIRNCEAQNSYFGIYLKDRNEGGIFANTNPGDIAPGNVVPLSGFGRTGNHVVEYSRIHNNSYGIYVESAWDLGSTIRYNLIYENHHQTDPFAASVKLINSEGANHPGGAIWFKDDELSPLAIYNNTFWHNFLIFVGTYQVGYQHLVFNNIFGKPNRYWFSDPNYQGAGYLDINAVMPNRITNCIYSRQSTAPLPGTAGNKSVIIMNGLPIIQGADTSKPVPPGSLIESPLANKAFPASANNRWLEMDTDLFISVDPASPDFLTPKWTDTLVQKYIKNQGWQKSGVKNLDGTWADLGAIPSSSGKAADLSSIIPVMPVLLPSSGNSATISFALAPRIGSLGSPKFTFFRWVGNVNYLANSWASTAASLVISNNNINDVAIPLTPVQVGANSYTVTIPAAQTSQFGFFEALVEGVGGDGKTYTSAVGFLPYRKISIICQIKLYKPDDVAYANPQTKAVVGDTMVMRIAPLIITDSIRVFSNKIDPVMVNLLSRNALWDPAVSPMDSLRFPNGITGAANRQVIFTKVPEGSMETIWMNGVWKNPSGTDTLRSPISGSSESINILPGPTVKVQFQYPGSTSVPNSTLLLSPGQNFQGRLSVTDRFGNNSFGPEQVRLNCISPSGMAIVGPDTMITTKSGVGIFTLHVPNTAVVGSTISIKAVLESNNTCDTAAIKVASTTAVLQPNSLMQPRTQTATVTCFDLQGRRIFHRTFESAFSIPLTAQKLLGRAAGLGSKVYMMEISVKDKATQKQTRYIMKTLSR